MTGMDIEAVLTRGVEQVLPSKKGLADLMTKRKITLYQGFDPTSTKLHIGHMVAFRKLRQFQALGHRVIFLIGDGTGQAGDPSGKSKTRDKFMTREELRKNARNYMKLAGKILDFEGKNPVVMKYNSEWLNKLGLVEILGIAENFSVQQLIERDMFQKRIKNEVTINLREFLYPLLQGYDSVAMGVDLEIGGSDQMFNMMAGRTLMKNMVRKEKYVLTTKLLTDPQGAKMGKTEGNAVNLDDKPEEIYGKVMAMGDSMLADAIEILTDLPISLIDKKGPMEAKKALAKDIVNQLHGEALAVKAEKYFEETFQKGEVPTEMKTVRVSEREMAILDLVFETGETSSRSEAKRLIKEGAVDVDGMTIQDPQANLDIDGGVTLKIGKKTFVKVEMQ